MERQLNLMMSLKFFSAYKRYYNLEADIETNLFLMMVMRRGRSGSWGNRSWLRGQG